MSHAPIIILISLSNWTDTSIIYLNWWNFCSMANSNGISFGLLSVFFFLYICIKVTFSSCKDLPLKLPCYCFRLIITIQMQQKLWRGLMPSWKLAETREPWTKGLHVSLLLSFSQFCEYQLMNVPINRKSYIIRNEPNYSPVLVSVQCSDCLLML